MGELRPWKVTPAQGNSTKGRVHRVAREPIWHHLVRVSAHWLIHCSPCCALIGWVTSRGAVCTATCSTICKLTLTPATMILRHYQRNINVTVAKCIVDSPRMLFSLPSIPHLTIVNVPIKWWLELHFKARDPPYYGTFKVWKGYKIHTVKVWI
jgi:hypothetical protein